MKALTILVRQLAVGLALVGLAHPAAAFETADLEGSWMAAALTDVAGPASSAPVASQLELTLDSEGTVTSGTATNNGGSAQAVTGTLSITSQGVVTASLIVAEDPLELTEFQMNDQKDFIAGVEGTTEYSVGAFAKAGTGYTTTDLQGNWSLLGFYQDGSSDDAGWVNGVLEIAGTAGLVSGGFISNSDGGAPDDPTGIQLVISSDGRITSPFLPAGTEFQLAEQRSLAVGLGLTNSEGDPEREILFLVKQPSEAAVSDVEGNWKGFSYYDLSTENDPGYTRGRIQVASDGTIVAGRIDDSDGSQQSVVGLEVAVQADGETTASLEYASQPLQSREINLQLSTDFQVMIGTATDPGADPYRSLQIAFVPEPTATLGALCATIALAVLRRRSS